MKKLPIAHIRLLCSAAIFLFALSPFFKLQTGESYTGKPAPYKISGLELALENLDAYFTNASPAPNKSLVIISFTVAIVMLMQLVAALAKRDKLIISSAGVLFFITVAGLVYIMQSNLPASVMWGYYAFMVVQLMIAVFTPIAPAEPKKWANKS